MDRITLTTDDGIHEYPKCDLNINLGQQRICVIGIDFDKELIEIDGAQSQTGIHFSALGKLSHQNSLLGTQIRNTLAQEGWDFIGYPDPEVVLMTENKA